MDKYVPLIVVCCLILVAIAGLYFLEYGDNTKKLSTYTYDFESAKETFENARQMFMDNNPNLYWKLMKIELNCGWSFYYKIERKKK